MFTAQVVNCPVDYLEKDHQNKPVGVVVLFDRVSSGPLCFAAAERFSRHSRGVRTVWL